MEGQTNPEVENADDNNNEEILDTATEETGSEVEEIEAAESDEVPEESGDEPGEEEPSEEVKEWETDVNFKYFGQEATLDEKLLPLIKNEEDEKYFKEMARKANSFDYLRETSKIEDFKGDAFKDLLSSKSKIDDHYAPLEENYNNIVNNLQQLDHHASSGDYHTFFDSLGIKKEDIINWAAIEVAKNEAPPEERMRIEQHQNSMREQSQMQYQNQQYSQQIQNQSVQTRTMELSHEISKPEISQFVQAYDQMTGNTGSFQQEVIREGQFAAMQGRDIPVAEAVSLAMNKYSKFVTTQPTVEPVTETTPRVNSNQVVARKEAKQTIPKVTSSSKSPVKKMVRNLDDIRKIRKQLDNQQL